MRIRDIEFDAAKAAANLRKHGVSFADTEQALLDPNAATIDDPDARDELRLVTLGMDSLGRVLVVVHTPRGERTRLISAQGEQKGARTVCEENMTSVKRGAAQSSRRPARRGSRSCSTTT